MLAGIGIDGIVVKKLLRAIKKVKIHKICSQHKDSDKFLVLTCIK